MLDGEEVRTGCFRGRVGFGVVGMRREGDGWRGGVALRFGWREEEREGGKGGRGE